MIENHDNATTQYATFFVAGLFFGIDVLKVQEVLRFPMMTRVPTAPDVIEGLINLRGQIVTALDVRRTLGLGIRPDGKEPLSIVVRTEDGAVSLLVDEIGDVLEVDGSSFDTPPESIHQKARELIRGVHQFEDRLLLVLDSEKVVEIT